MVEPVAQDARGIVDPGRGLGRFQLDRFPPSARAGRFVDRYWAVSWDLPVGESHTQQVLAHPAANLVLQGGAATVYGPTTRIDARTLVGRGCVLGVLFRPAGFRPYLGRPMTSITDRSLAAAEAMGAEWRELAAALEGGELSPGAAAGRADELLAAAAPEASQPSEHTTVIVEKVASDPAARSVETVAAMSGLSARQLQRRFADHVGLSPKAVIRRFRLYEAAERARRHVAVDWAALAAELGYSDQAHLVRDFASAFGVPPGRYARSLTPLPTAVARPAVTRPR